MYRTILKQCRYLNRHVQLESTRTLLSPAYSCEEAWRGRLDTTVLKSFDATELALKISEKLDRGTPIAAVDIDILANKANAIDVIQLEFLKSLFEKFRGTNESLLSLSSTSYGLLRVLLERDETTRLLDILSDKVKYGIFLDEFSASLILDKFIEKEMFQEAACIGYDLMLQEELHRDDISAALTWYACDRRHLQMGGASAADKPLPLEDEDDGQQKWIVVSFVEKPYYDDHFDISRETLKLGKTFVTLTNDKLDTVIGRNYHILGLAMWEKFDRCLDVLEAWSKDSSGIAVSAQILDDVKAYLDACVTREPPAEVKEDGMLTIQDVTFHYTEQQKADLTHRFEAARSSLSSASQDIDLAAELKTYVLEKISTLQTSDISSHQQKLTEWNQERSARFEAALTEVKNIQIRATISERLQRLKQTEEPLQYFEERDQIDIMIKDHRKMESIEDVLEEEQYVSAPGERGRAPK